MVECEESPFFSSVEILPPCSRQNDIRVIPNGYEESLHMSSRTKVRDLIVGDFSGLRT